MCTNVLPAQEFAGGVAVLILNNPASDATLLKKRFSTPIATFPPFTTKTSQRQASVTLRSACSQQLVLTVSLHYSNQFPFFAETASGAVSGSPSAPSTTGPLPPPPSPVKDGGSCTSRPAGQPTGPSSPSVYLLVSDDRCVEILIGQFQKRRRMHGEEEGREGGGWVRKTGIDHERMQCSWRRTGSRIATACTRVDFGLRGQAKTTSSRKYSSETARKFSA